MHIGTAPDPGTVVQVSDGVWARRIERKSPLPPTLDLLLARLAHQRVRTVVVTGARAACTAGEHERRPWVTGIYAGLQLHLAVCAFCGRVEVRDVSFDIQAGINPGGSGARRRSDVLGWYAGKRPGGRQFM